MAGAGPAMFSSSELLIVALGHAGSDDVKLRVARQSQPLLFVLVAGRRLRAEQRFGPARRHFGSQRPSDDWAQHGDHGQLRQAPR